MVRIRELFKEIEHRYDEKSVVILYDEVLTIIRDVLKVEGIERSSDAQMISIFEKELVTTGKVPARFLRDLQEIIDAKKKYDQKKLDKNDIELARKGSSGLIKFLVEYLQRIILLARLLYGTSLCLCQLPEDQEDNTFHGLSSW